MAKCKLKLSICSVLTIFSFTLSQVYGIQKCTTDWCKPPYKCGADDRCTRVIKTVVTPNPLCNSVNCRPPRICTPNHKCVLRPESTEPPKVPRCNSENCQPPFSCDPVQDICKYTPPQPPKEKVKCSPKNCPAPFHCDPVDGLCKFVKVTPSGLCNEETCPPPYKCDPEKDICYFLPPTPKPVPYCQQTKCPEPFKCDLERDQCYFEPALGCDEVTCHQPFTCDHELDRCVFTPNRPVIISPTAPPCTNTSCPAPFECDPVLNVCFYPITTPHEVITTTESYEPEKECTPENCQPPFQCDPITDICYFQPATTVSPEPTQACSIENCPPPFQCDPADGLCKYMSFNFTQNPNGTHCRPERCPDPFHCDLEQDQCNFKPPHKGDGPSCNRRNCPRPYQCNDEKDKCVFVYSECDANKCPRPFHCDDDVTGRCIYKPLATPGHKGRACNRTNCPRPFYCDVLLDECIYVVPRFTTTRIPETTPACNLDVCPPPFECYNGACIYRTKPPVTTPRDKCNPENCRPPFTCVNGECTIALTTSSYTGEVTGCPAYCFPPFHCDREDRCVYLEEVTLYPPYPGEECSPSWCQAPSECREDGTCGIIKVEILPSPDETTIVTYPGEGKCSSSWCSGIYSCRNDKCVLIYAEDIDPPCESYCPKRGGKCQSGVCKKGDTIIKPPESLQCSSKWCLPPFECLQGSCVWIRNTTLLPPADRTTTSMRPLDECATYCFYPYDCDELGRCVYLERRVFAPPYSGLECSARWCKAPAHCNKNGVCEWIHVDIKLNPDKIVIVEPCSRSWCKGDAHCDEEGRCVEKTVVEILPPPYDNPSRIPPACSVSWCKRPYHCNADGICADKKGKTIKPPVPAPLKCSDWCVEPAHCDKDNKCVKEESIVITPEGSCSSSWCSGVNECVNGTCKSIVAKVPPQVSCEVYCRNFGGKCMRDKCVRDGKVIVKPEIIPCDDSWCHPPFQCLQGFCAKIDISNILPPEPCESYCRPPYQCDQTDQCVNIEWVIVRPPYPGAECTPDWCPYPGKCQPDGSCIAAVVDVRPNPKQIIEPPHEPCSSSWCKGAFKCNENGECVEEKIIEILPPNGTLPDEPCEEWCHDPYYCEEGHCLKEKEIVILPPEPCSSLWCNGEFKCNEKGQCVEEKIIEILPPNGTQPDEPCEAWCRDPYYCEEGHCIKEKEIVIQPPVKCSPEWCNGLFECKPDGQCEIKGAVILTPPPPLCEEYCPPLGGHCENGECLTEEEDVITPPPDLSKCSDLWCVPPYECVQGLCVEIINATLLPPVLTTPYWEEPTTKPSTTCESYCYPPYQCNEEDQCVNVERVILPPPYPGAKCTSDWCPYPGKCQPDNSCVAVIIDVIQDPRKTTEPPHEHCSSSWCNGEFKCNEKGQCVKEKIIEILPPNGTQPDEPCDAWCHDPYYCEEGHCLKEEVIEKQPPEPCSSSWCNGKFKCNEKGECVKEEIIEILPPNGTQPDEPCEEWCRDPYYCEVGHCIKKKEIVIQPPEHCSSSWCNGEFKCNKNGECVKEEEIEILPPNGTLPSEPCYKWCHYPYHCDGNRCVESKEVTLRPPVCSPEWCNGLFECKPNGQCESKVVDVKTPPPPLCEEYCPPLGGHCENGECFTEEEDILTPPPDLLKCSDLWCLPPYECVQGLCIGSVDVTMLPPDWTTPYTEKSTAVTRTTECDCPPPFTCDANGDCVYIPTTPSKPKKCSTKNCPWPSYCDPKRDICVYVPPSKTTGSLPVTEGSSTTPNSGRTPCDCPPPFTCDTNGDCVYVPTSHTTGSSPVTKVLSDCDYDIDCPPDFVCVEGKCVPEETTTSEEPTSTPCDCPPPFTCDANGDCVFIPTPPSTSHTTGSSPVTRAKPECEGDIDCPPDFVCVDGKCVSEEITTSEEPTSTPCDCPPPFTCDANGDCVYIPTTTPASNITTEAECKDEDCPEGFHCDPLKEYKCIADVEGGCDDENCPSPSYCDPERDVCIFVPVTTLAPTKTTGTPCDCPPPFTCDANGDCVFIPTSPSTSHTTEAECEDEDCPEGYHCDPLKEYKCISDVEGGCDDENCPFPSYCDPERDVCIFVPVTTVTLPETTGTPCDCPPPFTCDTNGDCVFIPTPPPTSHTTGSSPVTKKKSECEDDTDCPTDLICVDGECVPEETTTSEEPTSTPCDCPPPFTCDANGDCVFIPTPPSTSHTTGTPCDCPPPFTCDANGDCVYIPTTTPASNITTEAECKDEDCPEGFHCDPLKEYKCIADVEGECDDENCPFPSYCDPERGICIFVPVTTVTLPETTGTPCDCPPPFTCDANGDCVFIPTPPSTSHTTEKSECETDSDCPPDFICFDGECVLEEITTSEEPTSTPCDCPPPFTCDANGDCVFIPTPPSTSHTTGSSAVSKSTPCDCPPPFTCDANGDCVFIPTPPSTSHTTEAECKDEDCPEGFHCDPLKEYKCIADVQGGCDDENCPSPSYCDPERGICIFVPVTTVTTPETTGTPCDCPPPFTCDANGDCVYIPTTTSKPKKCSPKNCPWPSYCDPKRDICVYVPPSKTTGSSPVTKEKSECETDSDCPPDFICVDGECVSEETTTSEEPTSTPCDCPPPFTCDANGDCVFIPTSPSTSHPTESECKDEECPEGYHCDPLKEYRCIAIVQDCSDENCPSPAHCDYIRDICVFEPTTTTPSQTSVTRRCNEIICPYPFHCDPVDDMCKLTPTTSLPKPASNVTCDSSWCKFPYQCDDHGQCIPPPGQTLPTLPPLATRDPFLTTVTPPYTIPVSPSGGCRDWCDPPYFCYEQLCVHIRYGPGDPLCDELPKRTTLKRS